LTNTQGRLKKFAEGIAAADRGEVIAHDDVMSEMETLIAKKPEEIDKNCLDQAGCPNIQKD
jgi:predicted transcriptional regulator